MAAFANTKGGYLVFGVTNSPRKLKGIDGERFLNTEPAKITEFLNEYFSPEIHWEIGTYEFESLSFGVMFVAEFERKPVVYKREQQSHSRRRYLLPLSWPDNGP
ncbi:MAG: ATP-binding protein [Bdellovibrionales bacterium]|nr:ATP-binding protein [Bdellovibrionales bacterium]